MMSRVRESSDLSESGDTEKLLYHDSSSEDLLSSYSLVPPRLRHSRLHVPLYISLLANATLAFIAVYLFRHPVEVDKSQILYSPAASAIEYTPVTFSSGYLSEISRWQSHGHVPTDEQDAAWMELYHELVYSRIPRDQAAQLTNLTVPIPGDEGMYVAGLDVFHQLHCLVCVTIPPTFDDLRSP